MMLEHSALSQFTIMFSQGDHCGGGRVTGGLSGDSEGVQAHGPVDWVGNMIMIRTVEPK